MQRPNVPKSQVMTYAEQMQMKKDMGEMHLFVSMVGQQILLIYDVNVAVVQKLGEMRRLTESLNTALGSQITLLHTLISHVLAIPPEALEVYRKNRDPKSFEKSVAEVVNRLAPSLITVGVSTKDMHRYGAEFLLARGRVH
jgi:hypothetical protein